MIHFKNIIATITIAISLSTPLLSMNLPEQEAPMAIGPSPEFPMFIRELPPEINQIIFGKYIVDLIKTEGHLGLLGSVCKNWYTLTTTPRPSKLSYVKDPHSIETACILEIFHNIVLRYDPSKQIPPEEGQPINLRVEPEDSLCGQFNLNDCGILHKHLSIHTGYKTQIIPETKYKLEIWLILRSEALKIKHFNILFEKNLWPKTAPIGIICYQSEDIGPYFLWHLTTQGLNKLFTGNLYYKMMECKPRLPISLSCDVPMSIHKSSLLCFSLSLSFFVT